MEILICSAAFLGGGLIALINALATDRQLKSGRNPSAGVILLRQLLSLGYLTGVYLLLRNAGGELFAPLLCAALGLTLPAIVFALLTARRLKDPLGDKKEEDSHDGGI